MSYFALCLLQNGGVCVGTLCPSVDALDTTLDPMEVPYTPQYLLKQKVCLVMEHRVMASWELLHDQ